MDDLLCIITSKFKSEKLDFYNILNNGGFSIARTGKKFLNWNRYGFQTDS